MAKVKKHKIMPFFKYLAGVLFIVTLIVLLLFKFIDILPGEYFLVLAVLMGLIVLFLSSLILIRHGPKRRAIGTFLSLIYLVILVLVIIYELKNSNYEKIGNLNNKTIGSLAFNSEGLNGAKEKLEKKIKPNFKTYDDISKLKKDFLERKVDAILLENAVLAILSEDDEEFMNCYDVVFNFSLDVETENITKEVDITKDTFSVYISGVDTYGVVSSVARSDVNMILTVNPKTHKVLVTSIPRDYYVNLADKSGKDKLTHAGIYGVETSVKTLEELLNIKINYYIKVNFTSLVKVVNALGGVKVYSKYAFTSRDGYSYKQGYNTVNGEKALSFVRERKAFNGGDRVRIENQAAMVSALIDKAISPAILTKYNNILKTLGNSFITNISTDSITEFIKKQIDDMPNWEVVNQALDGTDSYQYTYSYQGVKLYVMMPNMDTVINAQNKIKEIYGN